MIGKSIRDYLCSTLLGVASFRINQIADITSSPCVLITKNPNELFQRSIRRRFVPLE